MTPAERKAKIDAIQQEVLLAGHDARDVVKKIANRPTPPAQQSTMSPPPRAIRPRPTPTQAGPTTPIKHTHKRT